MDIKEIALQLAHRKCTSYDHVPVDMGIRYSFSDSHLIDFAEALVAEIQRLNQVFGYYFLPNSEFIKPEEVERDNFIEHPEQYLELFTFPPSIEALEDKVAEAISVFIDAVESDWRTYGMLDKAYAAEYLTNAIRYGEWKKFKGE